MRVQEALDRSALVPDGSDVKADTKDNVITLTGRPHAGRTRRSARRRVKGLWGIDVRDELQVTG